MDAENKSQGPNSDDDQERQIENESNRLFTANPQSLPDVRSQSWRNQSVPNLPLFGPTDSDTASTSIPVAEKFHFQKRVCRFYHQLSVGCGQPNICRHKLCHSNPRGLNLTADTAAILAFQLASRPVKPQLYCPRCPEDPQIEVPMQLFKSATTPSHAEGSGSQQPPKPFLYSIFASHPFQTLFSSSGSRQSDTSADKDLDDQLQRRKTSAEASQNESPSFWSRARSLLDLPSLLAQVVSSEPSSSPGLLRNTSSHSLYFHSPYSQSPNVSPPQSRFSSRTVSRDNLHRLGSTSLQASREDLLSVSQEFPPTKQLDLPTLQLLIKMVNGDSIDEAVLNSSFSMNVEELNALSVEEKLRFMKRCIRSSFSSSDYMCGSFLRTKEDDSTPHSVLYETDPDSSTILGVDLRQVRTAYHLLTQKTPFHKELTDALVLAQELLLAQLDVVSKQWKAEKTKEGKIPLPGQGLSVYGLSRRLRVLFILLESPLLKSDQYQDSLVKPLCKILAQLPRETKMFLIKCMAQGYSLDKETFSSIIRVFKKFLIDRYYPSPKMDSKVICCIRVLSLLYNVNEATAKYRLNAPDIPDPTANPGAPLDNLTTVPFSIFYVTVSENPMAPGANEGVLTSVNLKDEYPRWKKLLLNPKLLSNEFSLLNYPFLFDPVAKTRLLRIESLSRMTTGFERAYVHHAFLTTARRIADGLSIDFLSDPALENLPNEESSDAPESSHRRLPLSLSSSSLPHLSNLPDPSQTLDRMEKAFKNEVNPYLVLEVDREKLIKDTMAQLRSKWHDLHKPLKVKFMSVGEEGLDQGGVQKEFFQLILQQLLDDSYGLFFTEKESRLLWFATTASEDLQQYELFGLILGLALYNGVMVDLQFPDVFYKKLMRDFEPAARLRLTSSRAADGVPGTLPILNLDDLATIEDIAQLWPSLYKGLKMLLNWNEEEDGGTVEDIFCRNFEISYVERDGVQTLPLVKGGENIAVTASNRELYVKLYIKHLLGDYVEQYFRAIRHGFWQIVGDALTVPPFQNEPTNRTREPFYRLAVNNELISSTPAIITLSEYKHHRRKTPQPCYTIKLFRPEELRLLLTGLSVSAGQNKLYSKESFEQLQKCVTYEDFTSEQPYIQGFWKIVLNEFTDDQRRKLLWFVTASDRIPLAGWKQVTFCIQRNGSHSDRLPTALTCFGRLLLPEYRDKATLRKFLSLAIEESQGFGLI